MKICVVQTKPIKADIAKNIDAHKKIIDIAVGNGADLIIFPELSLTGYEPALAKELATDTADERFNDFQKLSDESNMMIGVGMPFRNNEGIHIGMIIFHPHKLRQLYLKKYLHADEEPFFVHGENDKVTIADHDNIALAICYELSVPEHAAFAHNIGANIYIASVAKTANGVEKAIDSLAAIATKYSMTVLLSNCIGVCDGELCGGKSAVWKKDGSLAAQLNDEDEGILIYDTDSGEVFENQFVE